MEMITLTDQVKNEKELPGVEEERNMLHTVKRKKANSVGHISRRNCLLKHVIEGKMEGMVEVTGKKERRRKQLPDDLKETTGYWKLKEESLDCTLWGTRFGRVCGTFVRQSTEGMFQSSPATDLIPSVHEVENENFVHYVYMI